MCGLYDNIQDKENRGRVMVNKCFVLHEEVIDVFHNKFYITTIEKLSFNLSHVRILGSMECGRTRNYCFHDNTSKKYIKLKKEYAEKFNETIGIEIQNQHWGGHRQLSMEVIDI